MKTLATVLFALTASIPHCHPAAAQPPSAPLAGLPATTRPLIEIAILLDTSGSMDGLIDQARSRLWSIVNTMSLSKKQGLVPELRVALFEYGNDGLAASEGHIRLIVPLSSDLDRVSEELFKLRTNGGQEYCGHAIKAAVERLEWSKGDHYRAVYVAGNEPFTQGGVRYQDACRLAISKGIVVNTIHCGSEAAGRTGEWDQGALLADGQFLNIDQNQATVAIVAPQDKALAKLSGRINATYVAFGRAGEEGKKRQVAQDAAAEGAAPGASVQRAVAKAGPSYRNEGWDLCDAVTSGKADLEKIKTEDLPAEMQKLSLPERRAFLEKKAAERKAIQDDMKKLADERDLHIAVEKKKQAGTEADTFDTAVRRVLKEQLSKSGFEVEIKN